MEKINIQDYKKETYKKMDNLPRQVKYIQIKVNPNSANYMSYTNLFPNLWLGDKYGKFVFLTYTTAF